MPVLTRSQKRPADEAPEIDDSRNEKKPGSGAHSTGQASVKRRIQKNRQKSTERRRAPPEKQAAVHAKDAAQHQARRADLPDEDRAAIQAQDAAQHAARKTVPPRLLRVVLGSPQAALAQQARVGTAHHGALGVDQRLQPRDQTPARE